MTEHADLTDLIEQAIRQAQQEDGVDGIATHWVLTYAVHNTDPDLSGVAMLTPTGQPRYITTGLIETSRTEHGWEECNEDD